MGKLGGTPAEKIVRGDKKDDQAMEQGEESSSSSSEFVESDVAWILKLGRDGYLEYGDGGGCESEFPVYYTRNKLDAFGDARRIQLLKLLWQLGESTLDKHDQEPVQDLICPDLFPNRLNDAPHPWSWNMARINDLKERDREDYMYEKARWIEKYGTSRKEFDEKHTHKFPRGTALRLGYLWLPSEFVVGVDGGVEICSAISGLERNSDNAALYTAIATLFEKMVPMYAKLGLIKRYVPTNLQVVVKAQSYLLEPGVQYSGKWHREGFRENIVASGVYYAEIEDGLHGGSLKFRLARGPTESYARHAEGMDGYPTTRELPIHEGRAVVFGNELPHRFRALSNLGDKTAKRTFLTFFVVDPNQRIPSTADMQIILPIRMQQVVISAVRKTYNLELPEYVVDEIGEFRGNHPKTLEEAKLKREEFRAAIREDKTGFIEVGYGNSGDTVYIPQYETHDRLSWDGKDFGYGSGFHSQSVEDEDWKDRGLAN